MKKQEDLLQEWLAGSPAVDWRKNRITDFPYPPPMPSQSPPPPPGNAHRVRKGGTGYNNWRVPLSMNPAGSEDPPPEGLVHMLQALDARVCEAQKRLQAEYDSADIATLSKARIVGMTTSGVARQRDLVAAMHPKVVLVEEAAEVFEPHILASLSKHTEHLVVLVEEAAEVFEPHILASLSKHTEHLVLIGDHEQLRPKPQVYELQAMSNRGFDLDLSMFERLVTQSGFPVASLVQQRRMRPQISQRTLDSMRTKALALFPSVADPWREVQGSIPPRMQRKSTSRVLLWFKCKIVCAVQPLITSKEAKVVILSLTRNNKSGAIGFLKMRQRINVLVSRAKHGMYLLGNRASLVANKEKAPMWDEVLCMLDKDGCVGTSLRVRCQLHGHETEILDSSDFEALVGDGGCQRPCEFLLQACGHQCPQRCHADDPDHVLARCHQKCDRLHQACAHPCDKLCHEECGQCMRPLPDKFELPCGHMSPANVLCWKRYTEGAVTCQVKVEVAMPSCSHKLTVPCCRVKEYQADAKLCIEQVEITMPVCGHTIKVACGNKAAFLANPQMCTAQSSLETACGHPCASTCGQCLRSSFNAAANPPPIISKFIDGADIEGHTKDAWTNVTETTTGRAVSDRWIQRFLADGSPGAHLRESYFVWLKAKLASMVLHAPCKTKLPCDLRCTKKLPCGHTCPSVCGEPCPSSKFCVHPSCLKKTPANIRDQMVEMMEMRSFHEYAESGDVDQDPLSVLSCSHTPSVSTLDSMVEMIEMRSFHEYAESGDVDQDPLLVLSCGHAFSVSTLDGVAAKEMSAEFQSLPGCLTCRAPISGVARYGRSVNKAMLDLADRRHLHDIGTDIASTEKNLSKMDAWVAPTGNLSADLRQRLDRFENNKSKIRDLLAPAHNLLLNSENQIHRLQEISYRNVKGQPKARVYEAMQSRLTRQKEDLEARQEEELAASLLRAEEAAVAVAVASKMLSALEPDMALLNQARLAVEQCGQALAKLPSDTALRRPNKSNADPKVLLRTEARAELQLGSHIVIQILKRISCLPTLHVSSQVKHFLETADSLFLFVDQNVPDWVEEAHSRLSYSSAAILSLRHMKFCAQRVLQQGIRRSGLLVDIAAPQGSEAVMQEQLSLIEKVRKIGANAQRATGFSASSNTASEIQEVLDSCDTIEEQVSGY
eukprot:gene6218-2834_t